MTNYLLKEFNLSTADTLSPVTADKMLYKDYLKLHDNKEQPREKEFAGYMAEIMETLTS